MANKRQSGAADWALRLTHGDIQVQAWVRPGEGITARTTDKSIEVAVDAQSYTQAGVDQLREGVPIFTNGQRVGQLRQPTRSQLSRSGRAVFLEWDSPERFPQGAYFRSRGLTGFPSLETKNERIISRDWLGDMKIHPRADAEVLCLWVIARYGLLQAVQS